MTIPGQHRCFIGRWSKVSICSIQAATKYIWRAFRHHVPEPFRTTPKHGRRFQKESDNWGSVLAGVNVFLALRGLRGRSRFGSPSSPALWDWKWRNGLGRGPGSWRVLHPALESDQGHAIWKRGISPASFRSVQYRSQASSAKSFDSTPCSILVKLFGMGYSWGGFESLIVSRSIVPDIVRRPNGLEAGGPTLRLHIGLENVEDLKADLITADFQP